MTAVVEISEAELQQAVIDTARTFGWRVAHFRPAQTKHGWRTPVAADGKGFPDLVLEHPTLGLRFVELKSNRGRLTAEQQQWIEALGLHADVDVWTPADWPERIVEILSGRPSTIRPVTTYEPAPST